MFKIKYQIAKGEFSAEDIKKDNAGGCDRIVIGQIKDLEGGKKSVGWFGTDGEKEMSHDDLFAAFITFASMLTKSDELSFEKRKLLLEISEQLKTKGEK